MIIPHDLEEGKIVGTQVFGPRMIKVRGNYDEVNRLCTQIASEYPFALVNVNLRPYYTEGAKTHGFEIAEQLGWRLPRHTVVPVAGGTILPKVWKAYQRAVRARAGRGQPTEDLRRAAGRAATRSSLAIEQGEDIVPAAEAVDHRQEPRHRQPRRRLLRARRGA